jgi:hypothetical protein
MINKVSGKRAFAVSGQTNNSVNDGASCLSGHRSHSTKHITHLQELQNESKS